MSARSKGCSCTDFLKNTLALRTTRLFILLLIVATLPILFVYHDQMSKVYGSSADVNSPTTTTTNNTTSSTTSPSSSSSISPTSSPSLWSTMHTVDYIYIVLSLVTLILHVHPSRPFFRGSQVTNLCVLIILAFIWVTLSTIWFTDVLWMSYDPGLSASTSSSLSPQPTPVPTATLTSSGPQGIPAIVVGFTLFPSQEPTVKFSIAPTATATGSVPQPTSPSMSGRLAQADVQWAGQCHTSGGLETVPCELMLVYHVLGCVIGMGLLLEGTLSWRINMREESVEVRLQKLQAIDDQKMAKRAKRTKRIEREMQALGHARPVVIQGPIIG